LNFIAFNLLGHYEFIFETYRQNHEKTLSTTFHDFLFYEHFEFNVDVAILSWRSLVNILFLRHYPDRFDYFTPCPSDQTTA
jgi:hypothetical protein